ncbi:MAG TPA: hypothetical protein VH475_15360 [Tepidisphaeraceae bacterium]
MTQRYEEIADVEVILKEACAERNEESLAKLRGVGMHIVNVDAADGAVEGTIPADRMAELKKLDCVSYVRTVFPYERKEGGTG